MTHYISIRDFRNNLAEISSKIANSSDSYIITKNGKPFIQLTSFLGKKIYSREARHNALESASNMWADRQDMSDPVKYVNSLRKSRFEL